MSLRIYHFDEQLTRDGADDNHRANVAERLARCRLQHADLSQSLAELLRRHLGRPQAAQSLSPDENVQRPNAQSVPVPLANASPARFVVSPRLSRGLSV